MKINRVFVVNQGEYNFLLMIKNFIKSLIKWYELFLIKFKNIKYREKKINSKFEYLNPKQIIIIQILNSL